MSWDCIVVGAGPGGSMAGLSAASLGLSTLILEQKSELGSKVRCAEGVGEQILDLVGKGGWILNELRSAELIAPDGTTIQVISKGFILDRGLMEKHLGLEAIQQGAQIKLDSQGLSVDLESRTLRVSELGKLKKYKFSTLIIAEGLGASLARKLGLGTKLNLSDIAVCAQYTLAGLELVPDRALFYFGTKIAPGGYGYLFPKSESMANLGVGIIPAIAPRNALYYLRALHSRMGGQPIKFCCGGVPSALPLSPAARDGILVVGDAARFTEPISGAGIINALKSGKLAAQAAAQYIADPDQGWMEKYDISCRAEFGELNSKLYRIKSRLIRASDAELNALAQMLPSKLTQQQLYELILKL